MHSRGLLEGKTTELKQILKSIILTPKIANKIIAFLFVLSIVAFTFMALFQYILVNTICKHLCKSGVFIHAVCVCLFYH